MREPWVIIDKSQVGDDGEVNAVFHVDHIEAAASYARLYERWYHSDERRKQAAEHLEAARSACRTGHSDTSERDPIANAGNVSDEQEADA